MPMFVKPKLNGVWKLKIRASSSHKWNEKHNLWTAQSHCDNFKKYSPDSDRVGVPLLRLSYKLGTRFERQPPEVWPCAACTWGRPASCDCSGSWAADAGRPDQSHAKWGSLWALMSELTTAWFAHHTETPAEHDEQQQWTLRLCCVNNGQSSSVQIREN